MNEDQEMLTLTVQQMAMVMCATVLRSQGSHNDRWLWRTVQNRYKEYLPAARVLIPVYGDKKK